MRDKSDEQHGSAEHWDALADPRREIDVGDRAARRTELLGERSQGQTWLLLAKTMVSATAIDAAALATGPRLPRIPSQVNTRMAPLIATNAAVWTALMARNATFVARRG